MTNVSCRTRSLVRSGLKSLTDRQTSRRGIVNHIGCSVIDINGFLNWYTENLGFRQVGKIIEFDRKETPHHGIFTIYGGSLEKGRCGFLVSENGIGLEVFQFDAPKQEGIAEPFQYHKSSFFHLCLTEEHPRDLSERLQEVGAKAIGRPIDVYQDDQVWCLYLTDPWGNVIELLNLDYEKNAMGLSGVSEDDQPIVSTHR